MTKKSMSTYLAGQDFFADLAPDLLDFLSDHARWEEVERGDVLFRHGEPADQFFFLDSGAVVVEVPAITGPSLVVQALGPGKALGWSWLIPPYEWSFLARATEPSKIVVFDGKAVREQCERNPEFGYALLKRFAGLMSERLGAARATMMDKWNPPGFA